MVQWGWCLAEARRGSDEGGVRSVTSVSQNSAAINLLWEAPSWHRDRSEEPERVPGMNNGNISAICHGITSQRQQCEYISRIWSGANPRLRKSFPSQASAACIQPSHNGERGNRRNSVLTSLLCLTRDITHFHGNWWFVRKSFSRSETYRVEKIFISCVIFMQCTCVLHPG